MKNIELNKIHRKNLIHLKNDLFIAFYLKHFMAVTFDMNEAKKATDVVIEVTEIVSVECFKVAFTILTKSSSPNFMFWRNGFL